jgi:hypothetical protein
MDEELITRYIELNSEIKSSRRIIRVMNKEKRSIEERIQQILVSNGASEYRTPDNNVCIKLKESVKKRSPTKEEILENIAEETGLLFDDDTIEKMKREVKHVNLKIVHKKSRV